MMTEIRFFCNGQLMYSLCTVDTLFNLKNGEVFTILISILALLSPSQCHHRNSKSQVPQPFNIIYVELELSCPVNFCPNSIKMILTCELLTELKMFIYIPTNSPTDCDRLP